MEGVGESGGGRTATEMPCLREEWKLKRNKQNFHIMHVIPEHFGTDFIL